MIDATYQPLERRPLASRDLNVVRRVSAWLIARGVPANAVSLSSIAFAATASLCLARTSGVNTAGVRVLFLLAALFIQLRLLANLLDGMIAVGSGHASPAGELYNEVPDRVADFLILTGAGFAAGATPSLGYNAALVAVFVAYLRALGGSTGVRGLFIGPMAKPQRMATMTAACVYCGCAPAAWPGAPGNGSIGAVGIALSLVIAGGVVTAWRRLRRMAAALRVTS